MSRASSGSAPRTAIIGGGLSGLAAAYELATRHPGHSFTLFEATHRVGGIVHTLREQGFTIEAGPDSWVTEKPWARELAEQLGLHADILPSSDHQRRTYITRGRELLAMPDGLRMMVPTRWEPVLHSPLLSWEARLAYLREPKQAASLKKNSLESRGPGADESVADFVLRHFGREVAATLAGPLLSGVFGGDIQKLSVRAVMAPFVRMEAEHGSLIEALRLRSAAAPPVRPTVFTTLRSGLETLIDKLVDHLPAHALQLNTPVTAVTRNDTGWQVTHSRGIDAFETLLLATPAHITRQLLATMHQAAASTIATLLPSEASSALVVALGFSQDKASRLRIPKGFGFLVPPSPQSTHPPDSPSLMACTFVDQKFADRVPLGGILLRGFFGGAAAETLQHSPAQQVMQLTRQQLSRWLGPLPEPDIYHVHHWPLSLPQYFVGHVQRIAQAETLLQQLPGLRLIGNAYHGVGLPDLVRDGRLAARSIVDIAPRIPTT